VITPETIRNEMQRLTGRRYQVKFDDLDEQTKRELQRFIRDAANQIQSAKNRARNQPWRLGR
jgi:c-di-GMP-binding flagellar brake protein YcgR